MKKILLLTLLLFVVTSCTKKVSAPEMKLSTVVFNHEVEAVDYETIRDNSELIVYVKVLTPLNMADSHFNRGDYHNHRQLEVLKVLKAPKDFDETEILFREYAAIDEDKLYVSENVTPLEVGEQVILFLKTTDTKYYELSNEVAGLIYTDDLLRNQNVEVAFNTIFEFMNPINLGKKVEFRPLVLIDQEDGSGYNHFTIGTDLYPIKVQLSKSSKIIKIGDYLFKYK